MSQKYKLIYCARINDDKHAGMLKVGDTDFTPTSSLTDYGPMNELLVSEAKARIKKWNETAAAGAELVYCDALIRYNDKSQNYEDYRDSVVHNILNHAGYPKIEFESEMDAGKEWFSVDLETVKAAIKASKEWRDYLDTSELPEKEIYNLRDEQKDAIKAAQSRFKNNSDMLWHAKMRFGKTISALNLVKKEKYKRTIIITHRPVVEDSWGSDFYHVFSKQDKYVFLTKIQNADYVPDDKETDSAIDAANDERLKQLVDEDKNIVYFASIQDLRGSKRVDKDCLFEKNNAVFDTHWDFVIVDEAHEGTKTQLGQKVLELLVTEGTKKLDLSGTAYNLLGKYTEKGSVYTWDYVMEQERKKNWPNKHPNEPNPYADMPQMCIKVFDLEKAIKEKGINISEKSFSFGEFFRTWTGELAKDGMPIGDVNKVGDFVHPEAVRRFLDLLVSGDESSNFPFTSKEGCQRNVHTLWMVPGVKEAAALSKMLQGHPFFGDKSLFGIANVAGEGDHDEEKFYHNALEYVRKKISDYPNTITLSCGRLTTGVTVKEWSAVFMLSGSHDTDIKQYMQTIFRVQSAGKIDGVQKTDAYVYDFAPDRALTVVAASVIGLGSKRTGSVISTKEQHEEFKKFIDFCPVVAIDGGRMVNFDVEALMKQVNRVQINRAVKSGFTDNGIYDFSKFGSLGDKDIDKLNNIFDKLKETKSGGKLSKAGMAKNGTGKVKGTTGISTGNTPNPKDPEKELRENIIKKLSAVSIRIPLLFFGGDFEIEEGRLENIITGIDDASWETFMPENLTKLDFRELVKYYNQETVIGAGKTIRSKAIEADALPPTERVIAITEIFSHFHNPAKETVLTPWRVVNMHMAETLGGWRFFNEKFEENDEEYYKRLTEPVEVYNGKVTAETLSNPDAKILEINSKSGLYSLYLTYSLYRAKLGRREEKDMLPEQLYEIWYSAAKQVYVLCQSSMAASITKHTLFGFKNNVSYNIKSDDVLLKKMQKSTEETAKEIITGSYWGRNVKEMKFDAIVGNPPYQLEGGSGGNNDSPIYQYFVDVSTKISPEYMSLIIPARWFAAGRENLLGEFRRNMLNNDSIQTMKVFTDSSNLFTTVEIKGGVCYFLVNNNYHGKCKYSIKILDDIQTVDRNLNDFDVLIRDPMFSDIVKTVRNNSNNTNTVASIISSDTPFGIGSNVKDSKKSSIAVLDKHTEGFDIPLYYIEKSKRKIEYVHRSDIKKNAEDIDKIKAFVPGASGSGIDAIVLGKPEYAAAKSVCSQSYLYAPFGSENEAENFIKYLKSKFFRTLVASIKISQSAPKRVYKFVPMQDFSNSSDINWNVSIEDIDKQLYQKYKLNDNQICYIDKTIKYMSED